MSEQIQFPEIEAFFHCSKCITELPSNVSPRDFSRLEVGWTKKGLQVFCVRHNMNVYNFDFKGQKVDAI